MEKKDAEAFLGGEDLGRIESYLEKLAVPDKSSDLALGMCTLRIKEAAPALRAVLVKAGDGTLADEEAAFFFAAVHILGAGRDQASFQPHLRFLRRPDNVDDLLGDADS